MKGRKSNLRLLLISIVIFCFSYILGCVSVEGPATQLQMSPGFVPKKAYNHSYDQMWDKVLLALRKNKIMVVSANKESRTITTDFVQGWNVDIAAIGKATYRYQYQIAFEKTTPQQTFVEVICKLEAKRMLKGGDAREAMEQLKPYEDVTHEMKKEAEQFELWLYEQIEKTL